MRVAAISHSCVIDINQQIYAELRKHPDVELLLIAPAKWRSSLRGLVTFSSLPGLEDATLPLPTRLWGHIHLHWYSDALPALREFGPDVLYVDEEPYSVVTSQALAWRGDLGCKFVIYAKQNLLKRYPPPICWMQQRVLNATDHAMVVSEGGAHVLRKRGYVAGVTHLPHGIDPEFYAPRDSEDLRHRLGVRRPIVGYVGRIAAEKGVWDLLAAARHLVARMGPEFTILMIGDGPARWKLQEAMARELPAGTFSFVGSVAHHAMPDYLNVLDLLLLPSRTRRHWKEQFGRVLVEALACGVPVVGSSSGNIPEIIEATGGGLVFEEGDPQDLAQTVERVLSDSAGASQMADVGRQAVLSKYPHPRVAEILYSTLRQVVDR